MDAVSYDQLRVELKTWEKNFVADNGRKPEREDIKSNAAIAAKYKLFNLSRPAKPAREQAETPKKRPQHRQYSNDALKERPQNIAANTPRKDSQQAAAAPKHYALSPVKEEQPTPAFIRSALGPTPQKDGHVLGIFDMLPSGTPSKPSPAEEGNMVSATPSKTTKTASSDPALSRTPQSSSKRYYLDAFVGTPLKRKRDEADVGTPSSTKKLYATPSFLRRTNSLAPIEESHVAESSAMPPPFRKRGMVRSLSNMIQNLKKQEQEDMDDDWDIMNELEAEQRGESIPKPKKPSVQVEDSQCVEMPLGPDQGPEESESEEDAPLGRDGLPRKAWKKKGLKRQTKRVKMKARPHKAGKEKDLADDESSESDDNGDVVAETQLTGAVPAATTAREQAGDESGSEYGGDDGEASAPAKAKKKSKPAKDREKDQEDGVVKKAVRKVSASAHANFRKLKIKNKNSKAGGRGGRFGRK